jgi:pseudouridine kinase
VARNIAENLARLEIHTTLLSAVGRDAPGKRVRRACESAGINCEYVRGIREGHTGNHVTVLDTSGEVQFAISDFDIIEQTINADHIRANERLIAGATMMVIDATLTEDALATVYDLAQKHKVRVAADPTSPLLAGRLCAFIDRTYFIIPNAAETHALCGILNPAHDRDTALQAAHSLVALGAKIAVVTLGDQGLAYADSGGSGYIRAIHTNVVDTTGAGDAFSGAAIFGLLNDVPVDEAMRLGVTAASLTLQSTRTVLPKLTQELLYDKLMA